MRNPHLVDRGRESSLELPLAYAAQGPPHYELIEMTGEDGLNGCQNGEASTTSGSGTDIERAVGASRSRACQLEAAQYTPDGKFVAAYFRPGNPTAVRTRTRGRRSTGNDGGGSRLRGLPESS